MKPITERIDDIPTEVFQVWIIQHSNQPIGSKLYEQCQEIIKKYPQIF